MSFPSLSVLSIKLLRTCRAASHATSCRRLQPNHRFCRRFALQSQRSHHFHIDQNSNSINIPINHTEGVSPRRALSRAAKTSAPAASALRQDSSNSCTEASHGSKGARQFSELQAIRRRSSAGLPVPDGPAVAVGRMCMTCADAPGLLSKNPVRPQNLLLSRLTFSAPRPVNTSRQNSLSDRASQ